MAERVGEGEGIKKEARTLNIFNMKWFLLFFLVSNLLLLGCVNVTNVTRETPAMIEMPPPPPEEISVSTEEPIPPRADNGDFRLFYEPVSEQYQDLQQILKETRLFEDAVNRLNNVIALPQGDVYVNFGECEEANAFYIREKNMIGMCYDLVDDISDAFSPLTGSNQELVSAILQTTLFIFYHEVGHALIDQLDLDVIGGEENAADSFATYLFSEAGINGQEAALNGAYWFYINGEETELRDLPYWNEHLLGQQRWYNVACLIYGKNPAEHEYLLDLEVGRLREERAVRCSEEYAQTAESWERQLAPYAK